MFSTSINNNQVICDFGFKKCISIGFQNPLFDMGKV